MTDEQIRLRKRARSHGRSAIFAMLNAIHPVYDHDEDAWDQIAIARARAAWRTAIQSDPDRFRDDR